MSEPTASDLERVYPRRHDLHTWSVNDRGFSHYTMQWGTVMREPDDQGWFHVKNDDGTTDLLNAERFVTPELAQRFGYGGDPKA